MTVCTKSTWPRDGVIVRRPVAGEVGDLLFPVIVRRWAEAARRHAGCAIVVRIDHGEFGAILWALERELGVRPEQEAWIDYTLFVAR
jgi:hypothetical protein